MNDFVLSCCSTADLSEQHFKEINVEYVCFHYELDGQSFSDDLGKTIGFHDFYEKLAGEAETSTSQVNADEYEALSKTERES